MNHMRSVAWLLVLVLGAPPLAAAQSLAEVAKKEKERRQRVKGSSKVITEGDLRKTRSSRSSVPVTAGAETEESESTTAEEPSAPAAAAEEEEKTDAELRAERQTEIQEQIDYRRKKIQTLQEHIAAARLELNDVSDMTYGGRRARLLQIVEDGQAEIAKLEGEIEDLTDQARHVGVRVRAE
jgi:hypothetical protein